MIGDYLEQYTFEYLINKALSRVPDTLDKREGSIIYDTLAPACYEMVEAYMNLRKILIDAYVTTASEQYLDLRVAEQGLTRYPATYATRLGVFTTTNGSPASVPIGARFSTVDPQNSVNYYVSSVYTSNGQTVPGSYNLICEETGTVGNDFVGELRPITNVQGLATATLTTVITPARDVETDEELRTRYFLRLSNKSFGGNVADYDAVIKEIPGVGEVQIYPVWNGGGTVKCSIISSDYEAVSDEFLAQVQNTVDPTPQGTGIGTAPIGHTVTITTPTEVLINVETTITPTNSYNVTQLQASVTQVIEGYLLSLRKDWGIANESNEYRLSVYLARVNASILTVPGVANVTNTKLNGVADDLVLTQTGTIQQLPVLGTVTLNG